MLHKQENRQAKVDGAGDVAHCRPTGWTVGSHGQRVQHDSAERAGAAAVCPAPVAAKVSNVQAALAIPSTGMKKNRKYYPVTRDQREADGQASLSVS